MSFPFSRWNKLSALNFGSPQTWFKDGNTSSLPSWQLSSERNADGSGSWTVVNGAAIVSMNSSKTALVSVGIT